MKRFINVLQGALVALMAVGLAACGGGGGGGPPPGADLTGPLFGGVSSIATAGGGFVRLDWNAAIDETTPQASIVYRVYSAPAFGTQNFGAPVLATAPGATTVTLPATVGIPTYYVVRAMDGAGNEAENIVELGATPRASGSVAFVSDTAGGTGTVGDPSDPFSTIQAGVSAIEGIGGGIVLVDAAAGGTTYNEEVDLTVTVSEIQLFGGFNRFSALPGGATGTTILATRDGTGNETTISGSGLLPFADNDLVRVANSGSWTALDGFSFLGTQEISTAITGTLYFQNGQSRVTGIGTLFATDATSGYIQLDATGSPAEIAFQATETELFLEVPYEGPSGSGAASIVTIADPAVRGLDARLQFSGCVLAQGSFFESDTTTQLVQSRIHLVGNTTRGEGDDTFRVAGGLAYLRFQNNRVIRRGSALTDQDTPSGVIFASTAGLTMLWTQNLLDDNRAGGSHSFIDFELEPADPANGGPLDLLIQYNEVRNHTSDGVRVDHLADIGAGGSVLAVVRHNLDNGASSSAVELNCLGSEAHAGVDIDIQYYENQFINGNGDPIESDITVSAGRTTTWIARDNFLAISESETIEVDDQSSSTADVHDQGVIRATILRNVHWSGGEELSIELGVTHGGRTTMEWIENTVTGTEEPCLEMDTESRLGTTTAVWSFPNGVICINAFNNDLIANDDEVIELEDNRDGDPGPTDSICIGWIGHNTCRHGSDPFDGGIQLDYDADNGAFLIERNYCGGGGDSNSDAACELDTTQGALWNLVRVQNNVFTTAAGGALAMESDGSMAQIVNITANYSGFRESQGIRNKESLEFGELQAYVVNCISTHNGGGDMDRAGGLRPIYTLIRDEVAPLGLGNVGAEPLYAKDFSVLNGLFPFTNAVLADLFSVGSLSPAVDAGHPDTRYNDVDGTRNDMGAFGGPNGGLMGAVGAGATMPFVYVGVFPAVNLYTGARFASPTETLWFGFNAAVDPASLAAGAAVTNGGVPVAGTWSVESPCLAKFVPTASLAPGASLFVDVAFNAALRSANGTSLAYPGHLRFAVEPAATPESEPNDDGVAGIGAADFLAAQALGGSPFRIAAASGSAADVDVYSFSAAVGQRLQATTLSARLGIIANEEIHLDLYDAAGNRITEGRRSIWNEDGDANAGDAYVDHVFDTAGTYYLVVTNPNAGAVQAYELQGTVD